MRNRTGKPVLIEKVLYTWREHVKVGYYYYYRAVYQICFKTSTKDARVVYHKINLQ